MTYRRLWDKFFTQLSISSIILLTIALFVILGPIIGKGITAVFFKGTVEFRDMQHALFGRGNARQIKQEAAEVKEFRNEVYSLLNEFRKGIDTSQLEEEAKDIYREYGDELRYRNIDRDEYREREAVKKNNRKDQEDGV